jgi:uncharacterized protein YbjT (DUF2867 family)
MKVAITGGTGFVGQHLAQALVDDGHDVVPIARGLARQRERMGSLARARPCALDISDIDPLTQAFVGCGAVAHCAGISHERGIQTFQRVHVEGTRNVVEASRRSGVRKILLLSFLRARAGCESPYHESKWAAEEIVRGSTTRFSNLA